jgi:hypothetical protein
MYASLFFRWKRQAKHFAPPGPVKP